MKTRNIGCALVLSLGLLNCGGAGGLTKTDGNLQASDTMVAAVTHGSNTHVDTYSVSLNSSNTYLYQVCPAHTGWDVVITLIGPSGSSDNFYCDSTGTTTGTESCTITPTSSGTYSLYVSDYQGFDSTSTQDRNYFVEVVPNTSTLTTCTPATP